jgi:hypothetical protein
MMARVSSQTKLEVAQLLRELRTTKSARESARLAEEIEKKVTEAIQNGNGQINKG